MNQYLFLLVWLKILRASNFLFRRQLSFSRLEENFDEKRMAVVNAEESVVRAKSAVADAQEAHGGKNCLPNFDFFLCKTLFSL